MFHEDLMKISYFLKNSFDNFSVILVFMQLSTSLRLLDHVILLYATVLGMILKDLVFVLNKVLF